MSILSIKLHRYRKTIDMLGNCIDKDNCLLQACNVKEKKQPCSQGFQLINVKSILGPVVNIFENIFFFL